jgi:hypothetical protein
VPDDFFLAAPVAPVPTARASAPNCVDHPGEGFYPGYGYAGGGFGPYQRCKVCHEVFGKTRSEKDGNDG